MEGPRFGVAGVGVAMRGPRTIWNWWASTRTLDKLSLLSWLLLPSFVGRNGNRLLVCC